MTDRGFRVRTSSGRGLYIMSIGLHGLMRGEHIELGRDADTGGQTAYMVDQARALARHPGVARVDLVTRLVDDKRVDRGYATPQETIAEGVRIVRLRFGPRRYLYKENLWPYLDAAVDQLLRYVRYRRRGPDVIHGHYADAGYVGSRLSKILAVPFIFTGHSLGRVKQMRLTDEGGEPEALEARYHFAQRIEAEEQALETAGVVIASTRQEVHEQYELYDHYHPKRMEVIPPGVDLKLFHPPGPGWSDESIRRRLEPFLRKPDRPAVLALSRPDERKNISTLVRAYAENPKLRSLANLILVMGTRSDIEEMEAGPKRVLKETLSQIDRYDLYGSVAYPKHLVPDEVPDLYRFVARTRGVLVNPALTEPFGLTLIEAAATGLPTIATSDGGPRDILGICRHGILVDPTDSKEMGQAILRTLRSETRWKRWSTNGLANVHRFSWETHADSYVQTVTSLLRGMRPAAAPGPRSPLPKTDRMLVVDLDETLTGDADALALFSERLEATGDRVAFVVATGRSLESAAPVIEDLQVRHPDVLVTNSGTEIYYGWPELTPDEVWSKHLDQDWEPDRVRAALAELPGVRPRRRSRGFGRFRISCSLQPRLAPQLEFIRKRLRQSGLRVTAILDRRSQLDVLPVRASPGLALRFLGVKLDLPAERTLVAGDSGNDADMLSGNTLGVVVGNYKPEIEYLRERPRIYFSRASHAAGVLEGIGYYDFFGRIRIPQEEMAS